MESQKHEGERLPVEAASDSNDGLGEVTIDRAYPEILELRNNMRNLEFERDLFLLAIQKIMGLTGKDQTWCEAYRIAHDAIYRSA